MQKSRSLPVILALGLPLGLLGGCDQSEVDAAGETVKGAAQQAGASLENLMKDLDLTNIAKLEAAKLQEYGKQAMDYVAAQLESVKDLPSAQKVSNALTPLIEKLEGLKTALGKKLPNAEEVKSAISSLKTRFEESEIMQALEPMLSKLEGLIG